MAAPVLTTRIGAITPAEASGEGPLPYALSFRACEESTNRDVLFVDSSQARNDKA